MTKRGTCVIQVAGDPTVDWMLVSLAGPRGPALQFAYQWQARATIGVNAQSGGSALLSALLAAVCSPEKSPGLQASVTGVTLPPELLMDPQSSSVTRTFSLWEDYPRRTGSHERAWRMREFLGQRPAGEGISFTEGEAHPDTPSCLVIVDTNLGFREQQHIWPSSLRRRSERPDQIILKMTNPLASGPLWGLLVEDYAPILTVYFSLGDLRKEDARVGQALSWEEISTDIVQAVKGHKELSRVARVIVSLGASGAVVVEREGPSSSVFDPSCQEGDWERERPASTFGLGTCMVASLAAQYAQDPGTPDWRRGVTKGLQAARVLHEGGFVLDDEASGGDLRFPADDVAKVLSGDVADGVFQCVHVPSGERWTIVAHAFPKGYRSAAERIVLEGASRACRGVPVERMGAWASVDRTEIESMRSVRNIIREYVQQAHRRRPLSIAVFGQPGAGKSFAIKQMALEWTKGESERVPEYNVCQFATTDELVAAFQRVSDCALKGILPLVFWDEFDAPLAGSELGWLPSFLAPMQDGKFLDRGAFRPIGSAIFVFAGGVYPTMAEFKAKTEHRSEVKGTDFFSRLRGFVDILGPNRIGDADKAFVLRRALLLRSLLEGRAPQLISGGQLNIDPGVLRAFLDVKKYGHGARSMESIIDMSSLSGKLRYERSALPAQHQLGLHVDAREFLELVKQAPPE